MMTGATPPNEILMKLPKRIEQHKSESDSYAILLYHLRALGVFRNTTESDYGIDFEVELVVGGEVTGQYFKAQVKSAQEVRLRKSDSVPMIGGIKQTTLYYWTELSYRTHVIVYAVDLSSETIYVSRPIFWQATKLLNGDNKKKSVSFVSYDPSKVAKLKEDLDAKYHNLPALIYTLAFIDRPSVPEEIAGHRAALRNLKRFFELYADVWHYDACTEVDPSFVEFLDVAKVLLHSARFKKEDLEQHDPKHLFSVDYWIKQSGPHATEVVCYAAKIPMKAIMPKLMKRLGRMRRDVLKGGYYWKNKNRRYLEEVYSAALPTDYAHETFLDWGYNFEARQPRNNDFWLFLSRLDRALIAK